MTETCQMCGRPVAVAVPHVTVIRQVETQTGDEVAVLDAQVTAYLHLRCVTLPTHPPTERAATA